MLEKVTEGDLAIFKNGEERKIIFANKRNIYISLMFNAPISCKTKVKRTNISCTYRYNGEWAGDIEDKNNIVKVIHMEEG